VLSVSKLSPGQEAYYERSVAGGLEDYYAAEVSRPACGQGWERWSSSLTASFRRGSLGG
jgi:hypothetical protein